MSKVSEVKVSYRRSIQPKQYETAEASVVLNLVFAEGEAPDVDEVISDELDRVQAHVHAALNIGNRTASVEEKTKAIAKPAATDKPPAAAKPPAPKAAAKPKAPAPAKAKAAEPSEGEDEGEKKYVKGDMMKAISNTLTHLKSKGIEDGPSQIDVIVRGYLTDDKPPYSYARIPENSWGDFIKDVEDLKNVA